MLDGATGNYSGYEARLFSKKMKPIGEGYRISTLVENRLHIVIAGLLYRPADWQPRLKLILRNIHSSYHPNDNDIQSFLDIVFLEIVTFLDIVTFLLLTNFLCTKMP